MRKVIAILMALCLCLGAFTCVTCDAKGGGGRTSGYSRSSAHKASTPKASAPKASAPKGNTSGYKSSKSNSTSSAPKGSSYTTKKDGKVTSGGGNTSGYKSKQTQTREQAQKNVAENRSSSSSDHWYGGTNNHYYDRDYDSGIGDFATGMIFGSLLSSPWHVYAGAPGYVGSYGATPGVAATGGFYSPFAGFIGVIVWFIEWAFIIACIVLAVRFGRLWWRKRRAKLSNKV